MPGGNQGRDTGTWSASCSATNITSEYQPLFSSTLSGGDTTRYPNNSLFSLINYDKAQINDLFQAAIKDEGPKIAKRFNESDHATDELIGHIVDGMVEKDRTDVFESILGRLDDQWKPSVALLLAIQNRRAHTIDFLLKAGVNPNSRDSDGRTSLSQAVISGDAANITQKLLDHGADIKWTGNAKIKVSSDPTPLITAVHARNEEMVELLLSRGADVNEPDGSLVGQTPLVAVLRTESKDIVELSIVRGADVDQADVHGKKPLSSYLEDRGNWGVEFGDPLAKMMLDRGAVYDLTGVDVHGSLTHSHGHGNLIHHEG